MFILPLKENLIQNFYLLESYAQVGTSFFYGLSLIGFALTHIKSISSSKNIDKIYKIFIIFLFLGSIFNFLTLCLNFISPASTLTRQVYLLIGFILSFIFLIYEESKKYLGLSLLLTAGSFFFTSITSFFHSNSFVHNTCDSCFLGFGSSFMIYFHIGSAVFGESLFFISCCIALFYLFQKKIIKEKKWNQIRSDISLGTIENRLMSFTVAGFIFLTVAFFSGILLIYFGNNSFQLRSAKVFWSFFIWIWYVIIMVGRIFLKLKSHHTAQLIIAGALFLLVALFGTLWSAP